MHWNDFINLNPHTHPANGIDEQELLLAKFIAARLALLRAQSRARLCPEFWQLIYDWFELQPSPEPDESAHDTGRRAIDGWLNSVYPQLDFDREPACMLFHLVRHIGQRLHLDDLEQKLLLLVWLRQRHSAMENVFSAIESGELSFVLARLLGVKPDAIHIRLEHDGRLRLLDLLGDYRSFMIDADDSLTPGLLLKTLAPIASESLDYRNSDVLDKAISGRINSNFPRLPPSCFKLSSFKHVPLKQLIIDILDDALALCRKGTNVLLYGPPGEGKTEFAKALASHLSATLYAVPVSNRRGRAIHPDKRLGQYYAINEIVNDNRAIILFDEFDDAFKNESEISKGWINQTLENNPIPTIWISNNIDDVDSAYKRRFDIILEINSGRSSDLDSRYGPILKNIPVRPEAKANLANSGWMTPAIAENIKHISSFLNPFTPVKNELLLSEVVHHRLSSMGIENAEILRVQTKDKCKILMPAFRTEWLNTDPGMDNVLNRLRERGKGRVCFYGPSGTGKSEMAKHLSKNLNMKLIVINSSDLLDKYVGGTERNIASAFRKAKENRSIILIDEIDNLINNRDDTSQTWEISRINEMLVQIENFDGIIFGTTNRNAYLDSAFIRRFDLKVGFDFLRTDQLMDILFSVLPKIDHRHINEFSKHDLLNLDITPGNISTALEQLDIRGLPIRFDHVIEALSSEVRHQSGPKRRIGF